ncbi:RHS repeat domain-containing protein [Bacteroidota bacterium]
MYREYNSLNQLFKVYNGTDDQGLLLQEYTFHPVEERVLVKKDFVKNETTYYFSKEFVRVVNESGEYNYTYVHHNNQLVAWEVNGEKFFVHGDHLGSSTVVTDESGNVLENTTYEPFGSIVEGGAASRYSYENKEQDSITGDVDFHARKYKSEWGLFIQPDKMIPDVYNPQALNRYSFELNNPYKHVDPDGRNPAVIGMAAFVVGSLYYLATNDGSGLGHVGKAYGHGAIWAAEALLLSKIKFAGGALRMGGKTGIMKAIGTRLGIGATASATNQLIDGGIDTGQLIGDTLGTLIAPGFQVQKAGTYIATKSFTTNTHKFITSYLMQSGASQAASYYFSSFYESGTSDNADKSSSSGRSYRRRGSNINIYSNDDGNVVGGSMGDNFLMSAGFAAKVKEALESTESS